MNLDFIKTKKAMIEYAESNQVKLTSTSLKDMKVEYLLHELQTDLYVSTEIIEGDVSNVTIKNKFTGFSTTIRYDELDSFCTEHELRLYDVQPIIDKAWLNLAGYVFSTSKGV